MAHAVATYVTSAIGDILCASERAPNSNMTVSATSAKLFFASRLSLPSVLIRYHACRELAALDFELFRLQ
jgi:hypothetical protein